MLRRNGLQQLHSSAVSPSLDNEIRDYVSKRRRYERLAAEAEEAKRLWREQEQALWGYFEAEDLKTVHHGLGRVTRGTRQIALIKDAEALMKELDDLGLRSAMTKIEFRKAEINKLTREREHEGADLPAGIELLTTNTITFTPSRVAPEGMEREVED